jgi:hypothetical protein
MFPVRYGLNFYINFLRNSVFKGLILVLGFYSGLWGRVKSVSVYV